MLASNPLLGPCINGLVARDRARVAVILDQHVEAFSFARCARLLEFLATAEFVHLQLAASGVEELDDFEFVVWTLVATTETCGSSQAGSTSKGESDDVGGLHCDDWRRVVGSVEEILFD
jgi:hypothetical protein